MKPEDKPFKVTPADRLSTVSEYYFSKKLREIAEMNANGKDIISLGIGSPDCPPSEETLAVMCKETLKPGNHGYQPYVGIPELRNAFADWYKNWYGVTLDPKSEIQPLIGSKEGVLHISMAFLNPGDGVLIPNPGYPTYASVSRLVGAKIHFYDLREENNWYPDFEALEKMDLRGVKLMWTNYPNMPTGAPATPELYEQLVAFARKHSIVLCNDNPYSFILNEQPISLLQIKGAKEVAIELNSMNKSHNMPGWRVGVLASNEQFVQWVLKVKSNVDSGTYRPMQLAAARALHNSKEWHQENNIDRYARRRALAEQIMTMLGCRYDQRQVGMFLWGKIPECYKSSEELSDKVLYDARVFVTPGFIFGSNGERYIRISLCAKEEMLQAAIERIQTII